MSMNNNNTDMNDNTGMNMGIFHRSVILNFIIRLYLVVARFIVSSKAYSSINSSFDFISNAAKESCILKVLSDNKDDESITGNSITFKLLNIPIDILNTISGKIGNAISSIINGSLIINKTNRLIYKLIYLPLRALFEGSVVLKFFVGLFIIETDNGSETVPRATCKKAGGILVTSIFIVLGLIPFIPTMLAAGLVVVCFIMLLSKLLIDKDFKIKFKTLDIFITIFMGTLIYGSVTSFARNNSIKIALIYIMFIMFYFIIVNTIKTKKMLYPMVVIFVLTASIVALYGIYQNFFGSATTDSWIDQEMFKDIKSRVYSTFDNPNVLGQYLVLCIPISIALMWTAKNKLHKLVYLGTTAVMTVCLIFTWSRGSWLGLIIALAIFALLVDRRLVALGFAGILTLPFIIPQSIAGRIASIGDLKDTSSAYRFSIWIGSIKVIQDYWSSGIGLGSEAFSRVYPKYALSGASYALHAHNLYLQLFVETGVIGIVAFLIIVFLFYRSAISAYVKAKDKFLSTLIVSLCAGMSGYLFQGLTDNIWYNYRMVLIFWIMLSLTSVATRIIERGNLSHDKGNSYNK